MSKALKNNNALGPQDAAELLPWLITDSLDATDAEAVFSLVESDELQAEVAATGEMLWLTEQQVPSLALAEYALGLPISEGDLTYAEIEAHLEVCAQSRAELELIRADSSEEPAVDEAPVIDFESARRRRETARPAARPAWRRYAVAAALAVTVTGALLVQMQQGLSGTVSPAETFAQVETVANEEILRSPSAADALFADGFESGDTSGWTFVTN